jgi:hypothetical protein
MQSVSIITNVVSSNPDQARCIRDSITGADAGFQVRGGAHLKKLRRAEGGAKMFGVFRVKNHDFYAKKSYFFKF